MKNEHGYGINLSLAGAQAAIEPLSFQTPDGAYTGTWDSISAANEKPDATAARGHISLSGTNVTFTLRISLPGGSRPLTLDWGVHFDGAPIEGAILHPVTVAPVSLSDPQRSPSLDLPSLHYGTNSYGHGLFPHPNLASGFAFRADRMGQPAIHLCTPDAAWSYFAADECPVEPRPDLVYSLGAFQPRGDSITLFFRYPQREFGHRGDRGEDAYIAKSTFGPGENLFATWEPGAGVEKTLYLWLRPPGFAHDYAATARFLWIRAYPEREVAPVDLWQQAQGHISWYNARLYKPQVGGGQYESPEGSGTAMLGFVEQSLLMAATTLRYSLLQRDMSLERTNGYEKQAADALTRWCTLGRSPEGLLYPACDRSGYFFGWRDYSDYENLTIVRDESFNTIRLASESRALLAAAQVASLAGKHEHQPWVEAAISVAEWLLAHPLPSGGYSPRYRRTGEPLGDYPSGTAGTVGLFCDCARLLARSRPEVARRFAQEAAAAYDRALSGLISQGAFSGGTLDASCPDREAAVAALNACLSLYELLGESRYLDDAAHAAANILSFTMVYPIRTFAGFTDAARRGISTFGSSIVSPENQHLDPVSTCPALLRFGLYSGDEVCAQAAAESLKWCLDGRWVIEEKEGLKQSEQMLNTRWFYNTFFSQRGDFRRGMPLWGLPDSEHGWPQVTPSAALLNSGQVFVDWLTGRAAGLDAWQVASAQKSEDGSIAVEIMSQLQATQQVYLKVSRLPEDATVALRANNTETRLPSAALSTGYILPVSSGSTTQLSIELR